MTLDRREFFKLTSLATTGLFFSKFDFLHAGLNSTEEAKNILVTANGNEVRFSNLLSGESLVIHSTATGHDFFQPKANSQLVYVVPKYEKRISILDLNLKKEVDLIKVHDKDFVFYGHIAFSADGTKFYSPQVNEEKSFGTVVVYDAKTNKPIDTIGKLQGGAHDTQFLSDNNTLVVTSSGLKNRTIRVEPSSINLFDVRTKKLIRKYHTDNPKQKMAHLRILPNDEIVILGSPVDNKDYGLIYSNLADSKNLVLTEWKIPSEVKEKLKSEFLSSSVNGKELLATNPMGSNVIYFDIEKREMIKVESSKENGVVTFKNNFKLVNTNAHAKLIKFG